MKPGDLVSIDGKSAPVWEFPGEGAMIVRVNHGTIGIVIQPGLKYDMCFIDGRYGYVLQDWLKQC